MPDTPKTQGARTAWTALIFMAVIGIGSLVLALWAIHLNVQSPVSIQSSERAPEAARRLSAPAPGQLLKSPSALVAPGGTLLVAPEQSVPSSSGGPPQSTGLPSQLAQMRTLGQELEQLPKGKIYLSAPIEMKVGDKRVVEARVGVGVPDDVLKGHARTGDQNTVAPLRVSHEMVATLSGLAFAITPITPERQTVAEGFPTVWEWEVKAKQEGAQELEATLYVLVPDVTSGTARQRIDSYTQKINVSVTPQTWGEWFASAREGIDAVKAIVVGLASITTFALGWLGISFKRRRRSLPTPTKRTRTNPNGTRSRKTPRAAGAFSPAERAEAAPRAPETGDQLC